MTDAGKMDQVSLYAEVDPITDNTLVSWIYVLCFAVWAPERVRCRRPRHGQHPGAFHEFFFAAVGSWCAP